MKTSFSLSSLQPSGGGPERAELARIRTDRPYNSLTKKRKEPMQEQCYKNWSGPEDNKDDFWAAIRTNYDYIMDTNLIDTCKEANGELAWDEGDVSTVSWGLKEVSCQFSELYSWLRVLQELVYSKEENLLDKSLRAAHTEELRRKAYRRRLFNEQAEKLIARAPSLKEEVSWRVDHLNAKWDLVEQIMAPVQRPDELDNQDVSADFEHEVKCLRKWLREMEDRLQPLNFRVDWSRTEIEEKAMEHMVLQKDIESHGRIVSSVVKLGQRVAKDQEARVASSLERRWHLLFLRALEWQCHIEALAARNRTKLSSSSRSSSDSDDEEPVSKQPRLSRRASSSKSSSSGSSQDESSDVGRSSGHSTSSSRCRSRPSARARRRQPSLRPPCYLSSDSEVRSADDGSYFEDDLDELCIVVSVGDKRGAAKKEDQGDDADVEEEEEADMSPTPAMSIDQVDSKAEQQTPAAKDASAKRRKTEPEETAGAFNTSNRKSKNCATFYFKHMDTDTELSDSSSRRVLINSTTSSSEEEWTYASAHSQAEAPQVAKRLNFDSDADMKPSTGDSRPAVPKEVEAATGAKNSDDEEDGACSKDSIAKLIREVEKLVREEGTKGERRHLPSLLFDEHKGPLTSQNHRAKYARIKEWLALNRCHEPGRCADSQCCDGGGNPENLDSCDASGEYTTGESDGERPCGDESEEDHQSSSVATCRRLNFSQSNSEELLEDPGLHSTPKVVMRAKRASSGNGGARPWSVSCITQIRKRASLDAAEALAQEPGQFSISETALNRLLVNGMPSARSASFDATESSRVGFNNSTSTLLEETTIGHDDAATATAAAAAAAVARVVRNSSLRRRKNRLRKKNANRKSESSSDGVQTNQRSENSDDLSSGCNNRSSARKSAASSRQTRSSRAGSALVKSGSFSGYTAHQESERANASEPSSRKTNRTSSESEDEEEEKNAAVPPEVRRFNDSDVEKRSFGNTSFSAEQAWDNYQEKYMSEPYSETADVESARRLLEFGDDYRNFLDSQSDCASSLSAVHYKSNVTSDDSDSDSELKRLAETSRNQLILSESSYMTMADHSFSELSRVCRENIRCLRAMSEASGVSRRRSDKYAKQIRGLMERWESLSLRAEEAQKISAIHREMAAMKLEFCAAHERLTSYRVVLEEPRVIEDSIERITSELANLRDRKPAMLALNVSTHRLITDLGQKTSSPTCAALKDGVSDLYRLWDEAFQKGNQQLCALQAVQQFGQRLSELQCALRRDKDTLAVLDAALKAGATMEVASSVRDVARLLSEKHEANNQQNTSLESADDSGNVTHSSGFSDTLTSSLLCLEGGSLSDSGISDSGSEQELSERERRLAALRRLTRTLESQLTPSANDEVLAELWRRVEEAEAELRSLQAQCRELIVRTAASVESRVKPCVSPPQSHPAPSKRKKSPVQFETSTPKPKARALKTSPDDPESEPRVPRSWVWRILRAALPFQLALVMLFCAACLLEPHCCEASNGMNLSLTPQLRYVRGPPPV